MGTKIVYKVVSVREDGTRKSVVIRNFLCLTYEQDKKTSDKRGILAFYSTEQALLFLNKHASVLASNIVEIWKCEAYIKKDQDIKLIYCDSLNDEITNMESFLEYINSNVYTTKLPEGTVVCSSITLKKKLKTLNTYQAINFD